jgi:hypothetical protein
MSPVHDSDGTTKTGAARARVAAMLRAPLTVMGVPERQGARTDDRAHLTLQSSIRFPSRWILPADA